MQFAPTFTAPAMPMSKSQEWSNSVVLIVDDESGILESLTKIFAREGLEVLNKEVSRSGHNPDLWSVYQESIQYHQSEFNDVDGYKRLAERLGLAQGGLDLPVLDQAGGEVAEQCLAVCLVSLEFDSLASVSQRKGGW